jgi:hypothetical protein
MEIVTEGDIWEPLFGQDIIIAQCEVTAQAQGLWAKLQRIVLAFSLPVDCYEDAAKGKCSEDAFSFF